ncbi:hypothetical protein B2J93_171 [Marssonina coronariae]|uniref:Uncharacterized protein n=1 Tax=Diplocarpon coronariae TaxID=2795749 RepID=A0A218Z8R1_9HELO|nr:hypothetical protein B2J93_171 [Marssonina coronariae]
MADAAEAGAGYVLVLPPACFGKATTPAVVERFYGDVAARSTLPVVVCNFPTKHSNIVGVKSRAQVGKITRLSAALPVADFATF